MPPGTQLPSGPTPLFLVPPGTERPIPSNTYQSIGDHVYGFHDNSVPPLDLAVNHDVYSTHAYPTPAAQPSQPSPPSVAPAQPLQPGVASTRYPTWLPPPQSAAAPIRVNSLPETVDPALLSLEFRHPTALATHVLGGEGEIDASSDSSQQSSEHGRESDGSESSMDHLPACLPAHPAGIPGTSSVRPSDRLRESEIRNGKGEHLARQAFRATDHFIEPENGGMFNVTFI